MQYVNSFWTISSADRLRDKTTKPILPKLSLQRWVGKIQAMGDNGVSTVHWNSHKELSTFCFMLPTHIIYRPSNTTCIVDILTIRTRRECLRWRANLYIPSNINTDFIFWHQQWISHFCVNQIFSTDPKMCGNCNFIYLFCP